MPGAFENTAPELTRNIDFFALVRDERKRQVHVRAVAHGDKHSRFSRHTGVNGVVRQVRAIRVVVSVCRNASDNVARVDVFNRAVDAVFLHVRLDAVAKIFPDIVVKLVAGSVAPGVPVEKILPGAFRDDDNGVSALNDAFAKHVEKSRRSVEHERHFRNEHEVGFRARERCVSGDKAGVAPHEFYDPDSVRAGALKAYWLKLSQKKGLLLLLLLSRFSCVRLCATPETVAH